MLWSRENQQLHGALSMKSNIKIKSNHAATKMRNNIDKKEKKKQLSALLFVSSRSHTSHSND